MYRNSTKDQLVRNIIYTVESFERNFYMSWQGKITVPSGRISYGATNHNYLKILM